MTRNILIAGVGGQGTLLASKIMGKVFLEQGYDIKVSEVHGMSQRGGSVITYVRYGEKVDSPLIDKGEADMLVSFELLETARWMPFLKPDGIIVTNTQQINPMPVISGQAVYPENIAKKIQNAGIRVITLDALKLAEEAGSARSVNMVLIGAVAQVLGFEKAVWEEAVKATVPAKTVDINLKAFDLGYSIEEGVCI